LEAEDLIEVRPPEVARPGFSIITAEWARQSPASYA
jgi:hypothetical protein